QGPLPPKITGRFFAEITIDQTRRSRSADVDNRGKAAMDILVRLGIVEDDRLCDRVTIQWGEVPTGAGCLVSLWSVAELPTGLTFTPEEAAMADAAISRWAEQLGVSVSELEQRLA